MKDYNSKFMEKIELEEADHEKEIYIYANNLKQEIEREKEGGTRYEHENEEL